MNPTTHLICTLKDTKAGILWSPQLYRSKADFVRSVQVAAKDKSTMLHKFPADYDLLVLGEWSEKEGIIGLYGEDNSEEHTPTRLGSVLDLCPLE